MHHWDPFWAHLASAGYVPVWFHYQAMNHDTSWVAATAALIVAALFAIAVPRTRPACVLILVLTLFWWLGLALFVGALGLCMTPPRSDNWAGVLGLFVGLIVYLLGTRNWAAVLATCYGSLAGGIGFALTDFPNMLGRAQWGPVGRFEALHNLDYWKWMEQGFGLVMGFGVGLGFLRILRGNLAPAKEDVAEGPMDWLALIFLFVIVMWENLFKNVRNWYGHHDIEEALFGLNPRVWFVIVGVVLTLAMLLAIYRHRREAFILWISVIAAFMQAFPSMNRKGVLLVHTSFWLTGGVCTLIVLSLREQPAPVAQDARAADDRGWLPGWKYWAVWACTPVLIWLLATLTVASHTDRKLEGSQQRFETQRIIPTE